MLSLVAALLLGQTSLTTETLVLTTSTAMPKWTNRRAIEIQNLGPNTIYCSLTAAAVVGKSRAIVPGGTWSLEINYKIPIYCIAATANQVTGAATITTEVP